MQKELQVADVLVAAPDMPFAFDPHWATWVREVERYEIGPSTALVGHSTGAGFWVGYLGAHPELRVGRVALVAPWIDPYDEYDNNFFDDCIFDPLLTTRVEEVAIFVDPDDIKGVVRTVELLVEWIPGIRVFSLPGYGHFTTESMGGVAFPELAEFLLPGE